MDEIDTLIRCLAKDIVGHKATEDGMMEECLALYCEPERRLLALLLAYQLGDELANKVCGDPNNP